MLKLRLILFNIIIEYIMTFLNTKHISHYILVLTYEIAIDAIGLNKSYKNLDSHFIILK